MDLAIVLLSALIGLCDGLAHAFLFLAWLTAWPFRRTARGFFALADRLTFGPRRP